MGRDGEDSNSNVFVSFKQHLDDKITSGFNTILGLTTVTPHRPESSTSPPSTSPHTMELEERRRHQVGSDVSRLVTSAAYSPVTLRHLPQPIPNDIPHELDSAVFTFEDAFEDLLVASQGLPLPDIRTRHEQRTLLRKMFPSGEPAWFWIRRLESQGLIAGPINGNYPGDRRPDWESFHRELDRRAGYVWRHAMGENENEPHGVWDFFRELDRPLKRLEQTFSGSTSSREGVDAKAEVRQQRETETFDDLFESVSSTLSRDQKSWDAFVKQILNQNAGHGERPALNGQDDTKQVETRSEHVDEYGYLHSTVTRKTLDKDDVEIGRQTFVTVRPAESSADKKPDSHKQEELDNAQGHGGDDANKKSGWFWT
ncbi:hypothetical protein DCS_03021 [Drechmeria coniospora]|uniref:Uncharacterized protein n=1 Tax=Drechmeria coniospora TaxID=98403 RepID=A0A151GXQ6_DRECN|nr:hypothetical protein DCS_03021 [Drechmeria coniospora]KYK61877.1 hypothetical protein DCS_03021 [Drechmeria coniospora]ODA82690.1 hypothetical protein RJ55_01198 [Drechmeria coniospora]